jgi:hypothetical protein
MPFNGIVHPEHLDIMTKALQAYCRAADIKPDTPGYELVSLRVLNLFQERR